MILCGHNIDEMRKLPAGSVQLCVTSPPYFGLRDYKIPPSVWGGDLNCEHEWLEHTKPAANGIIDGGMSGLTLSENSATRSPQKSNFCKKCGAWLGNLGLEPDPELYVRNLSLVFRELWRVLRDDGTLWVNLGDSSAGSRSGEKREVPHMDGREYDSYLENGRVRVQGDREIPVKARRIKNPTSKQASNRSSDLENAPHRSKRIERGGGRWGGGNVPAMGDLKPKDLIGIPWMVAFALRADGWYLRSRIPWIKRNPMPESADDRPTIAIEDIFLLSKRERYFYDGHAVKMPASLSSHRRMSQNVAAQRGSARANGGEDSRPMKAGSRSPGVNPKAIVPDGFTKQNTSFPAAVADLVSTRSRRNSDWFFESWQGLLTDEEGEPLAFIVNTAPYKEAHFATFPIRLVTPMIRAGTSDRGACVECGAPWKRVTEKGEPDREHQLACGSDAAGEYEGEATKDFEGHRAQNASATKARILDGMRKTETVGWHPTCDCVAGNPKSQTPSSKYFVRSVTNRRIERCVLRLEIPHDTEPETKYKGRSNAGRLHSLRDSFRARGFEFGAVGQIKVVPGMKKRRDWYRADWQRRIDAHFPKTRPCVVIDPFGGSGTTAAAALELGREPLLIDISADYTDLSRKRTGVITPSLALFE